MPVNPNPDYYKRQVLPNTANNDTAFSFDKLSDYQRFIDDTYNNCERNSRCKNIMDNSGTTLQEMRRETDPNWYGTTDPALVTNAPSQFLFNNELDLYMQNVRARTIQVDKIDLDQQKPIQFTDREIGVFSFDLASLGLIPVYEYYSPLLKKIVNPNYVLVEKDENNIPQKNANGELMFYHIYREAIPEHEIIYDASKGGYFSKLLGRVVQPEEFTTIKIGDFEQFLFLETPEIQKHSVNRQNALDSDGKKRFTTTFKKCFVHLPQVEKPLPRLDIIISCSYSAGVNARTEMIYSSMSAIAIAEKLSKSGINYRLIVGYGLTCSRGTESNVYGFLTIKKEGEIFDKNNVALMLSDGRIFRSMAFRGYIAMQYDSGKDANISDGIGRPVNDNLVMQKTANKKYQIFDVNTGNVWTRAINREFDTEEEAERFVRSNGDNINRLKNAYIEMLANSTDPADKKASENRDSKIVFSGALNENSAVNQYNLVVQQITRI